MSTKGDWKKLITEVERQGARIVVRNQRTIIFPPDRTKPPISVHGTPSDVRALANARAELRKAGFDL